MKIPLLYSLSLAMALATTNISAVDRSQLEAISRLIQQGQVDQAMSQLDQINGDRDWQVANLRALALARGGQRKKAIRILEKIVADNPPRPEPFNNLAALYANEGQLEKAKSTLEAGLRTDPAYAAVYENLSMVYVEMARNSYIEALKLGNQRSTPDLKMLAGTQSVDVNEPVLTEAAKPVMVSKESTAKSAKVDQVPTEAVFASDTASQITGPIRQDVVIGVMQAWASAWSRQDHKSYLSFYGKDFVPEGNLTRNSWERVRRVRIKSPSWINVTLADIKVEVLTPDKVNIQALQQYKSDGFSDDTLKEFTLTRSEGDWQISAERSITQP